MKKAGFLIISFTVGLFACAAPAVKTTTLVPARYHEATKLKEVAVLPFDGPTGREFAAEIEGDLASINIDDKQFFTLIDRTKIQNILKEQALSQTGVIDENTAAKVGKLLGARGIYVGRVTSRDSQDTHYTQNREECAEREIKKDKKGNPYEGNCVRWRKVTVPCTKRDAVFAFTPKLIEVETGRIVYSNNASGMASSSACRDSGTPLPNELELIGKAKESAKLSFKRDIAPSYVTFDITLMDSKDGISSKAAEQKLDLGMEYAKNKRLDRACEIWGEGRILSPTAPSFLYNLAICAEIRGDLENALDLYLKADRALSTPDERITAGIGRVSEGVKKEKILKDQLK